MTSPAPLQGQVAVTQRRPALTSVGTGQELRGIPRQPGPAQLLEDRRRGGPQASLQLLMVEDSAADGRLVVELLREAGLDWLVERLGGRIWVEPQPTGSVFCVELPQ